LLAKPDLAATILSLRKKHPDILIELELIRYSKSVNSFVRLPGVDVILLDNMNP